MSRVPLRPGQQGAVSASKRGKQWRARTRIGTTDGDPIQVTAVGPTRQSAIDRLQERVGQVRGAASEAAKAPDALKGAATTLGELAEEWWRRYQKRDVAAGTLRAYSTALRRHLFGRFDDLTIATATVGELNRRVQRFEEETGLNSRTLRVVLTHVFDLAVREDLVATNAVKNIEPPPPRRTPPPRALTVQEWARLKIAIKTWGELGASSQRESQTLLDVLVTQAATGTRINETLALRPCDLSLEAEVPTATIAGSIVYEKGLGLRHGKPKTTRSLRTVVLPAFVVPMLRARVALAPTPEAPVFASGRGTWLWANNLRRQWRAIRDDADLSWVTPHHLRKTVLTLVADSFDLDAAAAQAGHRSTRTTAESYVAKPALARDAGAVAALLDAVLGDSGPATTTEP